MCVLCPLYVCEYVCEGVVLVVNELNCCGILSHFESYIQSSCFIFMQNLLRSFVFSHVTSVCMCVCTFM